MLKLQGLNKAIGDYHRANSGGPYSPRYGVLMLDKSTGEIWTDEFYSLGQNDWKEYHSNDIINLGLIMENEGYEINRDSVKDFVFKRYKILSDYLKFKYVVNVFLRNGYILKWECGNYKEALKTYKYEKNNRMDAYIIELNKYTLDNYFIQALFCTLR